MNYDGTIMSTLWPMSAIGRPMGLICRLVIPMHSVTMLGLYKAVQYGVLVAPRGASVARPPTREHRPRRAYMPCGVVRITDEDDE